MRLNTLNEIKNGTAVLMPSGIRAKLFLEDENVIVEYPELYRDKYTKEQFTKLMEEGIMVLTPPSQLVMESKKEETIIDKLTKKGFIRESLLEAFENQKAPGALFTLMQDEEKEYLTDDFKKEMLIILQRIAKEYPDVKVRQQALTFMDALGLQEYFDTKAMKEFCNKYSKLLNTHVNESLDYEEPGNTFQVCIYDGDDENAEPECVAIEDTLEDAIERAKYEYSHSDLDENTVVTVIWVENGETLWYIDKDCEEKLNESLDECDTPEKMGKTIDKIVTAQRLGMKDKEEEAKKEYQELKKKLEKDESLNEEDDKFNYMLLARLKQDCGYFLGNGNGYEPHLWAGNVEDQIAKMKELYNKVPEKPEWLSMEDIDNYEKEMLAKRNSKNEYIQEISKKEWDETPEDYKDIIDGQTYKMYLGKHGTELRPVKVCESLKENVEHDLVCPDCGALEIHNDDKDPHYYHCRRCGNVFHEDEAVEYCDYYESLNEEQGPYFGNDAIGNIAKEIEAGNKSGYEPEEFGNWLLNTNMDNKWEAITEPAKDFLMEKIAMPVADGHVSYDDLEIWVSENSALAREDIESFNVFMADELDEIFIHGDELKFLISYELQFDGQLGESFKEKSKKKKKEKIDDSMEESLNEEEIEFNVKDNTNNTENGPFANREAAEAYVDQQVAQGRKEEEFEIVTNNGENDMSKQEVTPAQTVTESYKVYHTQGAEVVSEVECDSWQGVEEYLNQTWGDYRASMVKENPEFGTDEDKDAFFGEFEIEPIEIEMEVEPECNEAPCVEEPCEVEAEVIPAEEICPDCGEAECICNICPDCGQNPCVCTPEEQEERQDEESLEEDFGEEHIGEPEQEETEEEEEKIETPQEAKDKIEDMEDALDSLEDYIKELLDAEPEQEETEEIIEEPLEEEFKDGMLTNVQDLDMPDAIAQTIDVNDDGTVMRLKDIMEQVKAMKSEMEKMIQDFKTDMKDALGSLQQTIQRDVNDVDNKVQDTKSAVDNLTTEEEELEGEFEPLEEEPMEGEEEAPAEEEEKEQQEESVKQEGPVNPIFEAIETVINEGGKTKMMVLEELKEKYGYDYMNPSMSICINSYIDANKLNEKLIGTDEALALQEAERSKSVVGRYLKKVGKGRLQESLEDAKKKTDELVQQGKSAEEIKDAITLLTDNDQEKQQAAEYAVSKMKESLLKTSKKSKLGGLGQVD